jgi:hypothetical protein
MFSYECFKTISRNVLTRLNRKSPLLKIVAESALMSSTSISPLMGLHSVSYELLVYTFLLCAGLLFHAH